MRPPKLEKDEVNVGSAKKQPVRGVVTTLLGDYVNDPSGLTMHASYMITACCACTARLVKSYTI